MLPTGPSGPNHGAMDGQEPQDPSPEDTAEETAQSAEPAPGPEPLGREWIGPGLLLAGALALGRAELLARLAQGRRGVDPEWARWAVLGEWQAELVQGLVMGCVAAAVVWSGRGVRRLVAILVGAAILASALSGWPVAPPEEIAAAGLPGIPEPWLLAAACLAAAALVSALAWFASGLPLLRRLLSRQLTQLACAALGLGLPAYVLHGAASDAPGMTIDGELLVRTRASRDAPSLLLVAVDALRIDRVGFHGYGQPTTPALDALARRGLAFERAFASSSWTAPSLASLFTGLEPDEHGLTRPEHGLAPTQRTLAEALSRQGLTTSAVIGAPELSSARGFAQGFERYDAVDLRRSGAELSATLERELERLADVRFFLAVQLADLRAPRTPLEADLERLAGEEPEAFPGLEAYAARLAAGEGRDAMGKPRPEEVVPREHARWIRERYDASVASVDRMLGRLMTRLEDLGLAETTLVVVLGTHGEELLEHGQLGHGHGLWSEQLRVPLVIAGPGVRRARVHEEVSLRHLAPSLAQRLGSRLGHDDELLDLFLPQLAPERLLTQTSLGIWNGAGDRELHGLRGEVHSLILRSGAGGELETRFFAVEGDPHERTDLAQVEGYRDEAQAWTQALRERVLELRRRAAERGSGEGGP